MAELAIVISAKNQAGAALGTLQGQLAGVEKQVNGLKQGLQGAGQALQGFGAKMSLGVTAPLAGMGLMAVNAASDLNESLSKVNVVFDQNAAAIEAWSQTAATSFGISQQQALESAGTFGNLFDALGMGSEETAEMSTGLVQLASDLASFNNIDPTEALEKLRAGIVGETEPLRTLGVNLTAAAVETKALEMGLAATAKQLTDSDKVTARYALIMESTANAQGDFARTSTGLANSQRIMKAQLTDTAAKVGTQLLPYMLQAVEAVSQLVGWFGSLSPAMQQFAVMGAAAAAAIGPLAAILGTVLTVISALISPIGLVVAAVGLLGAAWAMNLGGIQEATAAAWATIQQVLGKLPGYVDRILKSIQSGSFDWHLLIPDLDWGEFVTSLGNWSQYVGSLLWNAFVTALDWTAGFVTSLDWGGFVTALTDWSQYVGRLLWDAFVIALDWTAGFVTSLDWGGFVKTLGDWGQYITQLTWDAFVTVLDWTIYAGNFAWDKILTALPWSDYVPDLDLTPIQDAFGKVTAAMETIPDAWEAVQAIVDKIATVMAPAFERLQTAVGDLPDKFSSLSPQLESLGAAFGGLMEAVRPVLNLIGMLAAALGVGLVLAANLGINLIAAAFERLPQLLAPIMDQITATINLISSTLTEVTAAVKAMAEGDWSAAWDALQKIVDDVIAYVTESWENFTQLFGELGELFAGIVPPGWFEKLTGWKWPTFQPPELLSSLLSWTWPSFPALPSIVDTLVAWQWPTLQMPGWLSDLLNFQWRSFPQFPSWLGGQSEEPPSNNADGGRGNGAIGSQNWRGGMTMVGETGPELVMLPRGSRIFGAQETAAMQRSGAGVAVTVESMVVRSDMDIYEIAYRVADLLARG